MAELTTYTVRVCFLHEFYRGEEWYEVEADHVHAAQFQVAMKFGQDVLIACMRTGFDVKVDEFAVYQVGVGRMVEKS